MENEKQDKENSVCVLQCLFLPDFGHFALRQILKTPYLAGPRGRADGPGAQFEK